MVERKRRLDQPSHAGGGHGVADLRRDGAERPRATTSRGKDGAQGAQLRAVGGRDSQSVAFDEVDGRRIDTRIR